YYNIDNWIYSAKSNARYQRKHGTWIKEATSFRGQWGIAADQFGRLVYNHNSAPLIGDKTLPNVLLDNPYLKIRKNVNHYYTNDMRLYPIQATAVNRGYEKGVLDEDGKLKNFTSACSPIIYLSDGLSETMNGDGFVCAPEANLISHYEINHIDQMATKDSSLTEFLVSTDETFRPVALNIGYDDALYIVDMRKGIIQHSAYMSSYLREKILAKKLDQVTAKGNIYRVKNQYESLNKVDLASITDLPALLLSQNRSLRIWAQQKIIDSESINISIIDALKAIAMDTENPIAALHAWWTLDGLESISSDLINKLASKKLNSAFAIGMLPLLKNAFIDEQSNANDFDIIFRKLLSLQNDAVDIQLASIFSHSIAFEEEWWQLANRYKEDEALNEALLVGVDDKIDLLVHTLKIKR
ncbi:MAG: hypothetical protein AAGK97_15650, partial [Bacteroidota bacterium]